MIFVVEMSARAEASAWFAYDLDDLMRKIAAREPADGVSPDTLPLADGPGGMDGARCRIFWNEAEATAAFERADDPWWAGPGWRARHALREQLVATEVLADDL